MHYLGTCMPAGVMVILVIYCVRDLPQPGGARLLAPLLALTVTIGLHLWRHNALLSILGGITIHVLPVSTLLSH